ncbi:MAG: DUF1707 domain-containing protein [Arachnia sp.]
MTDLPPSSRYLQQSDAAVEEMERESLSNRLADAYADGRIEQDEYMSSLDTLYSAQRLGDLVPVVRRLPAPAISVPDAVGQGALPAGQTNGSRNVLLPAIGATAGLLLLLALLIVLGGLFWWL